MSFRLLALIQFNEEAFSCRQEIFVVWAGNASNPSRSFLAAWVTSADSHVGGFGSNDALSCNEPPSEPAHAGGCDRDTMASMRETLNVALVSDVFFDEHAGERLRDRLADAKARGADLALLPEIPLTPWSPATTMVRGEDAEPPDGPRHQMAAGAARDAGSGVVGGAIVRDPATGRRYNQALVFDAAGRLIARYAKVHLPDERRPRRRGPAGACRRHPTPGAADIHRVGRGDDA